MLADAEALQTEAKTKPPLLLVHGDADPMVPFTAMGQAETAFKALDFDITTLTCPNLGHSIDEDGLQLGGEFLARMLGVSV